MKKKILECARHGTTLFRCKRRSSRLGSKKDKKYVSIYSEQCFKCIAEGLYKQPGHVLKERNRHLKIYS